MRAYRPPTRNTLSAPPLKVERSASITRTSSAGWPARIAQSAGATSSKPFSVASKGLGISVSQLPLLTLTRHSYTNQHLIRLASGTAAPCYGQQHHHHPWRPRAQPSQRQPRPASQQTDRLY